MGSLIGSQPGGCQNFRYSDLLGCGLYRDFLNAAGVEFDENGEVWQPLRGKVMTNDFSGGLRGLRPPATFFATLQVVLRSVNYIVTDLSDPTTGTSASTYAP